MKNFEKRRTTVILCLILMLSIVAACGMLASTYAKYTDTFNRSDSITVAKWDFLGENDVERVNFTIDPTQSADVKTLVDDRVAPGTSGSFKIKLTNANTDTGIDFVITLDTTNQPTNLKFYYQPATGEKRELKAGSNTITGQIAAKDSTGVEPTIYWEWPYETSTEGADGTDTREGKESNDLTAKITVTGTQRNPGTNSTTTTGINEQ